MRTVEKRCDTRIGDAAVAVAHDRAARRRRSARTARARFRRRARPSARRAPAAAALAHEAAGERELLPLAERHLDAAGPGRAELRLEARRQPGDDVVGAGAARPRSTTAARRPGAARRRRRPCGARGTRSGRSPGTRPPAARASRRPACARAACRRRGSRPDVGSYSLASSLTSVVLPAPFSPTIATTAPAGSSSYTSSSTRRSVPG